jgi:hypothetical protein
MSIASEITRIAGLRDTIRSKLLDFGIITSDSANLSDCATAIDGISKVTPSIPATTITIDTAPTLNKSTGVITMSASKSASIAPTVSKGYTDGSGTAGTITAKVASTLQLSPTQGAQTITPTTSNQTIAAGRWLTGAQTIKGDSNLVAANIVSGKSIFGVAGGAGKGLLYKTGTVETASSTAAFYYNTSGSTRKAHYITVPISGVLPIGIFAYVSSGRDLSTMTLGTATVKDTTCVVFSVHDLDSTCYTYFVPFSAGASTLNVPVGYYSALSDESVKYWLVTEVA